MAGAGVIAGGSITTTTTYSSSYELYILREVEYTQPLDLVENDPLPAENVEEAFDRNVMMVQDIRERVDRSLKVKVSSSATNVEMDADLADSPNYFVKVNNTGDGFELSAPTAASTNASVIHETYIATAGQTVFTTITSFDRGINSLQVFINGVRQTYNIAYVETNPNTVTFNEGLDAGDRVDFYIGIISSNTTGQAANISYTPAGTGAVATNVQNKLRESVSVLDFGATGDGITNDEDAFNAAWTASNPQAVLVPAGTYEITGSVTGSFYSFGVVTINTGSVTTITNLIP